MANAIEHFKVPNNLAANVFFSAICCAALSGHSSATDAERDLQSWNAVEYTHRIDESWALGLQGEVRLNDNISRYSEIILKPAAYYYFSDEFYFGAGYKHITKNDKVNEQDLWQEVYLKQPIEGFDLVHQIRLEQRFIGNVDGIIPQLRYLIEASYPFQQDMYLVGSESVHFNLVDKGIGPVSGFEQNRLYFGLGVHASTATKLEFGYLWRYEKERSALSKSDHSIRVQIKINTDGRN